jgi:hypothetical protein
VSPSLSCEGTALPLYGCTATVHQGRGRSESSRVYGYSLSPISRRTFVISDVVISTQRLSDPSYLDTDRPQKFLSSLTSPS